MKYEDKDHALLSVELLEEDSGLATMCWQNLANLALIIEVFIAYELSPNKYVEKA